MDDLESLRRQISELDDKLVALLKKRIDTAKKIGETKRAKGESVFQIEREIEVLSKVRAKAETLRLNPADVEAIFKDIIGSSRRVQEEMRVAFLGPSGSFSEEAAFTFFSSIGAIFLSCFSISDVFRKVEIGEADYGVIPVESSIEGSVTASLDQFLTSELKICGEVEVPVRLHLILHPSSKIEEVKEILSHHQALAQCRRFLEDHFPGVPARETSSTSEAVRLLTNMKGVAAIGPESAAKTYNMRIEARDIQDAKNAFTRFLVLGSKEGKPTGKDKTTIIFSVKHIPGALYKSLKPFASRGLNISKIESRPTKRAPWEYVFFLDFDGHKDDPACREALEELRKKTLLLKILGSYPRWK
jgi:chorismate mutase/prephenate dehydratase